MRTAQKKSSKLFLRTLLKNVCKKHVGNIFTYNVVLPMSSCDQGIILHHSAHLQILTEESHSIGKMGLICGANKDSDVQTLAKLLMQLVRIWFETCSFTTSAEAMTMSLIPEITVLIAFVLAHTKQRTQAPWHKATQPHLHHPECSQSRDAAG